MRMHREKTEQPAGQKQPERRKDLFTRAVVSGLQEMTAAMEKLPEGEAKSAALAAVDRYAQGIATAIERKKQADAERAKHKPTAFTGATLARESGDVLQH